MTSNKPCQRAVTHKHQTGLAGRILLAFCRIVKARESCSHMGGLLRTAPRNQRELHVRGQWLLSLSQIKCRSAARAPGSSASSVRPFWACFPGLRHVARVYKVGVTDRSYPRQYVGSQPCVSSPTPHPLPREHEPTHTWPYSLALSLTSRGLSNPGSALSYSRLPTDTCRSHQDPARSQCRLLG